MTVVTREISLNAFRHSGNTLKAFMEDAKSDQMKAQILEHILNTPMRELSDLGGPDARLTEQEITSWRKKIAKAMVDATGAPVEMTMSDIHAALNATDPQTVANVSAVLDLMRSEPKTGKRGGVKGFGDLKLSSGERRGAAYVLSPETAQRFEIPYDSSRTRYKNREIRNVKSNNSYIPEI
jgi:nucleoid DNA-binding protein